MIYTLVKLESHPSEIPTIHDTNLRIRKFLPSLLLVICVIKTLDVRSKLPANCDAYSIITGASLHTCVTQTAS